MLGLVQIESGESKRRDVAALSRMKGADKLRALGDISLKYGHGHNSPTFSVAVEKNVPADLAKFGCFQNKSRIVAILAQNSSHSTHSTTAQQELNPCWIEWQLACGKSICLNSRLRHPPGSRA